MTVDEFEMDPHYNHWQHKTEWDIKIAYGDMTSSFSVIDDDVQQIVSDNFDHFSETIEKELTERVENDWDNSLLTDEEKFRFLEILRRILA